MASEKNDSAKFLAEYRTSHCLFCKKLCKVILFRCHEIWKRRFAKGTVSNGLNLFPQLAGIVKQNLGHLLPQVVIISSIQPISSCIYSILEVPTLIYVLLLIFSTNCCEQGSIVPNIGFQDALSKYKHYY